MTRNTWLGRLLLVTLILAMGAPGAPLQLATAGPIDVMVACPNRNQTGLWFPRDTTYAGGRVELQWRVLVNQPVSYRLWIVSPVSFTGRLLQEQAGRFQQRGTFQARFDGQRWVADFTHAGEARGDPWLWVIAQPQANPNAGEFLSHLVLQCDAPRPTGGGGSGGGAGGGGGGSGCRWQMLPGAFGQGVRSCVCQGRGVAPDSYCAGQP